MRLRFCRDKRRQVLRLERARRGRASRRAHDMGVRLDGGGSRLEDLLQQSSSSSTSQGATAGRAASIAPATDIASAATDSTALAGRLHGRRPQLGTHE